MGTDLDKLPTGTVTFFFSDIENSTALWEAHPQGMRAALAWHDEILRSAVIAASGVVIKSTGDGLHAVFPTAEAAVAAALAAQKRMAAESWSAVNPDALKVRIGIHSGEAQERDGDYFGPAVNRAARLMAIGHGGQVLVSGVTAALLDDRDGQFTFMDMGDVRLRGLKRPEHVYQLQADGLQGDFPPLRTEAAVSGNLPQQLTSFVGREKEKEEVSRLLSTAHLLTLTGPGGTGKTRLSLEVAGALQDHYANGVWLVELAPLTEPNAVPAAVAGLWNLHDNPLLSLEQVLADYLRGKEMLLILDNCEHLVTASARLASALLAVAPRLTILASSREGLGIAGETTYHLPALRIPETDVNNLETLQEFESVQLFADRAQAVQPGFSLTEKNAPAVGRIVRRLDGIPLAIELAAARLKLLPPKQLAERLDDRFRLLTGGSRTALPRQQTLRALIDWSYDLLDEEERWFLRQLSVFAGGWTLEAAETVADLETEFLLKETHSNDQPLKTQFLDAFDLLANLVNKSLVLMDEEKGHARFSFLETIRQYARDRLFEAAEGPAARDRHLNYFADLVIDNVPLGVNETHLSLYSAIGSPEMMAWVLRARSEIDNIRMAVEWALQTDPELALAMATKLPLLYFFEGSTIEPRQWLEESLQAVNILPPATGKAAQRREILLIQGALWVGNLQLGEGLQVKAVETLQTAVEKARENDLPRLLAMALSLQSLAMVFLEHPGAFDTASEGLVLMEEVGETTLKGIPLGSMVMAKMQQGDFETAQVFKERAKGLLVQGPNTLINGLQIVTLARFATQSQEFDEAEELLEKASDLFDLLGSRSFRTMVESERGHIRRHKGDDAAATAIYRHTIQHWQELGHKPAVANQLETLGFIAIHEGWLRRAGMLLGAAEALREQIGVDMLPLERTEYEAEVAALRETMGVEALAAAWQDGRALDMDTAVALALRGATDGQ